MCLATDLDLLLSRADDGRERLVLLPIKRTADDLNGNLLRREQREQLASLLGFVDDDRRQILLLICLLHRIVRRNILTGTHCLTRW
jgi:hypothetical protein